VNRASAWAAFVVALALSGCHGFRTLENIGEPRPLSACRQACDQRYAACLAKFERVTGPDQQGCARNLEACVNICPAESTLSATPAGAATAAGNVPSHVTRSDSQAAMPGSDSRAPPADRSPAAVSRRSIAARLRELQSVYQQGLIDEQDYAAKKREILESL